jgi:hypothetical protein
MLRGMVLPTDWDRVYAAFFVLCEIGDIDPGAERWEDTRYNESETISKYLKRLWDNALEAEPNPLPIPRPAMPQQAHHGYGQDDPWVSAAANGYSDEPPF